MTVGVEPCQADLFKGSAFVRERLAAESVFAVLEREGCRLFPEAMFDDLFSSRGRRSVAPRVVACVMVLQRWFGLSDREAVAAFEFDLRWRFACGGLDVDGGGFCHTVLVGMRARLAASSQPRRIFDAVLAAARSAGALSQRRVLDSVPIYDAVATQDTATMLQRAIRAVLAAASDAALGVDAALRGDYASGAKPRCDWDDPRARQELVDRLGADAAAVLAALEGRRLRGALSEAAELLAAVAGQDLCQDRGGRFMIARRVAKDRVLSTVDPDARHGHKSTARRFDASPRIVEGWFRLRWLVRSLLGWSCCWWSGAVFTRCRPRRRCLVGPGRGCANGGVTMSSCWSVETTSAATLSSRSTRRG